MDPRECVEKAAEKDAQHQKSEARREEFHREVQKAGGDPAVAIDFNTFLISLGGSALMQLTGGSLPGGEKIEQNLELAHQTIDILGILEQKTRGNLTPEENELLTTLLYDLRVRYVQTLHAQQK